MKATVISNCVTDGYQRYFSHLLPGSRIAGVQINDFNSEGADLRGDDVVFCISPVVDRVRSLIEPDVKLIEIPPFYFSGYHPDTVPVVLDGDVEGQFRSAASGPLHSLIGFAAFTCGRSVAQTIALFTVQTYRALGYFDEYPMSKSSLLTWHSNASLDIGAEFRRWSRKGCFVHAPNHPHLDCVGDIARLICKMHFTNAIDFPYSLPDYLADHMVYPVYPGIAERWGARGSLTFKVNNDDRSIDLTMFIRRNFEIYEEVGVDRLSMLPYFQDRLERAQAFIRGG